jgi:hypothetical protein
MFRFNLPSIIRKINMLDRFAYETDPRKSRQWRDNMPDQFEISCNNASKCRSHREIEGIMQNASDTNGGPAE